MLSPQSDFWWGTTFSEMSMVAFMVLSARFTPGKKSIIGWVTPLWYWLGRVHVVLLLSCKPLFLFSRTLTAVHDAILEDLVFPSEIVGKRTKVKMDGSRLIKVWVYSRTYSNNHLSTMARIFVSWPCTNSPFTLITTSLQRSLLWFLANFFHYGHPSMMRILFTCMKILIM